MATVIDGYQIDIFPIFCSNLQQPIPLRQLQRPMTNVNGPSRRTGLGLWAQTDDQEVVSLNPSTAHLFVVNIVLLFEKAENKIKRGRGWPIF